MYKNLNLPEWLLGIWEGNHGDGLYHEEWQKSSETEFFGKAYLIRNDSIGSSEILKLNSDSDGIYYTADVSHNPKPVRFNMVKFSANEISFENPEHDFPQKITYERKDDNSLLATIESIKGNKAGKIVFYLKKIN